MFAETTPLFGAVMSQGGGFTSSNLSSSIAPSISAFSSTLPLMPVISTSALSFAPLSTTGECIVSTAAAPVDSTAQTRTTSTLAIPSIPIQTVYSVAPSGKQQQRAAGATTAPQNPLLAPGFRVPPIRP